MNDYHYIPETTPHTRTYTFRVTLVPNTNGHWEARIASLPGCRAWGYTKDEALQIITRAAEQYVHTLLTKGLRVPSDDGAALQDEVSTITVTVSFSSLAS